MTSSPLPVILDGDPGVDDAAAWLLAFASPELRVLGVTTTHGNVALAQTTHNAGVLLALAGEAARDVPLFAGADRPLLRVPEEAHDVHGQNGLPAHDLPAPLRPPADEHAALFLIRAARAAPGEITVIATGPLTNLALALRLAPDLAGLLREIVWMGGGTAQGNRTPAAEANALTDPHAAAVVFGSGMPLRMVGLNVTMQCIADPQRVAALRAPGNRAGAVTAELLEFYAGFYHRRYGLSGGAMHDPLAVAAAVRPDLLTWQAMPVTVDTAEGPNLGRTVCDLYGVTGAPANARVAVGVDAPAFFELFTERLARLP
ncbi:nucleoside hydrolase [Deinococcus sp. Leaf326]|uniref:nucleoside hydrolase n=1 Tax=Deinococcus sp. Leaf326 TaxID=1736338 RepID=UPI0006FD4950|nr:nucleoside hydrolase [Deinococcus sp. Leaf326]KQR41142.1 ribonucleoside hydrolase [Deinococcus sp. Leaf326]